MLYSISWCYLCSFDLVGGAPMVLLITKLLWNSFNYLQIHSCQDNNLAGWQPHDVWQLFVLVELHTKRLFHIQDSCSCTCIDLLACLHKNSSETYYPLLSQLLESRLQQTMF